MSAEHIQVEHHKDASEQASFDVELEDVRNYTSAERLHKTDTQTEIFGTWLSTETIVSVSLVFVKSRQEEVQAWSRGFIS